MGPKTKRLIVLGQTMQQRHQLGENTPSITDNWENALAKDHNSDGYGGEVFDLPPNHKGALVSDVGFSCATCKWVNAEKHECNNKYYINWNDGSKKLPDAPLENICSDWWESKKK